MDHWRYTHAMQLCHGCKDNPYYTQLCFVMGDWRYTHATQLYHRWLLIRPCYGSVVQWSRQIPPHPCRWRGSNTSVVSEKMLDAPPSSCKRKDRRSNGSINWGSLYYFTKRASKISLKVRKCVRLPDVLGFKQCYILSSDGIDFIIEDICINWFLNLFTYKTNQMSHYLL